MIVAGAVVGAVLLAGACVRAGMSLASTTAAVVAVLALGVAAAVTRGVKVNRAIESLWC